jgi:hypothetical protein
MRFTQQTSSLEALTCTHRDLFLKHHTPEFLCKFVDSDLCESDLINF